MRSADSSKNGGVAIRYRGWTSDSTYYITASTLRPIRECHIQNSLYIPLLCLLLTGVTVAVAGAQERPGMGHAPPARFAQDATTKPEADLAEPIITEETLPNEVGDWDLRLSGGYMSARHETFGYFPRLQLFFGIANRLGGEIDLPFAYTASQGRSYGPGDLSATLKYVVQGPARRAPAVVLGLETTFPTGDASKGAGENQLELEPFVALLKSWERVTVQGNVGYSVARAVGETRGSNHSVYNGAVAFSFAQRKLHLIAEVTGSHGGEDSRTSVALGVKYSLTPERFVALAVPLGLNSQTRYFGVVMQVQISLRKGRSKDLQALP